MKRISIVVLAAALALVACGGKPTPPTIVIDNALVTKLVDAQIKQNERLTALVEKLASRDPVVLDQKQAIEVLANIVQEQNNRQTQQVSSAPVVTSSSSSSSAIAELRREIRSLRAEIKKLTTPPPAGDDTITKCSALKAELWAIKKEASNVPNSGDLIARVTKLEEWVNSHISDLENKRIHVNGPLGTRIVGEGATSLTFPAGQPPCPQKESDIKGSDQTTKKEVIQK